MYLSKNKYTLISLTMVFALSVLFVTPINAETSSEELPSIKETKAKEGYIINLRDLIKKSKNKIEEVNDKIKEQAVRRRNQQREEKAREYYNKAMELFEQNKLKEAEHLWKKAIKITDHPEMKGYIRENVRKTKKQEAALREEDKRRLKRLEIERGYSAKEVEERYSSGVALFKQKKYLEARADFELVEEMFPDHRATRSYLMIIDQEIEKEQQKLIEQRIKEEAVAQRKEKEEWRRQIKKEEEERQDSLYEQAQEVYNDAIKLYKTRQFEKAKKRFKEVEWIVPDYKSTLKYLSRIDDDILQEERNKKRRKREEILQQAEMEDLAKRREEERKRRVVEFERKQKERRLEEEASFVYKIAVSLYKKKHYDMAQGRFLEVNKIYPGYRGTEKYLRKIKIFKAKEEDRLLEKEKLAFERETKAERLRKREEIEEKEIIKVDKVKPERKLVDKDKEELENLYDYAKQLYRAKSYNRAKEKFQEVELIQQDYKSTSKYLNKIEKVIVKEIYKDAISLLRDEKYSQSKLKFSEVQKISQGYKKTSDYLRRINVALKSKGSLVKGREDFIISDTEESDVVRKAVEERRKQLLTKAESKYSEALYFYKSKDYVEAKHKFIEVEALLPGYKDTLRYLEHIDEDIKKVANATKKYPTRKSKKAWKPTIFEKNLEKDSKSDQIKFSYKNAVSLYKAKQWLDAKEAFEKIEDVSPNYKSTRKYIRRIENRIFKEIKLEKSKKNAGVIKKEPKYIPGDIDIEAIKRAEEQKDLERRIESDILVGELIAKEKYEESVEKQKYRELREKIQEEALAVERLKREREKLVEQKQRDAKRQLLNEELAKRRKQKEQDKINDRKIKDLMRQQRQEELEAKRIIKENARLEKQKELEAKRKKKEEENRKKEEELAKKKEEEELVKKKKKEEEFANKKEKVKKSKEQLIKEKKQREQERRELKKKRAEEKKQKEQERKELAKKESPKMSPSEKKEYKSAKKELKLELKEALAKNKKKQARQKVALKRQQKNINKIIAQKEKSHRHKWKKDVEIMYKEAVGLYRMRRYKAARTKFASVEGLYPGYKAAQKYLEKCEVIIEARLKKQEERLNQEKEKLSNKDEKFFKNEGARLEEKAKKEEERKKIEEARLKKQEEIRLKKKKAEEAKKAKLKLETEREKSEQEINKSYKAALMLYKKDKLNDADEKFQSIIEMLSDDVLKEKFVKNIKSKISSLRERIKKKIETEAKRKEKIAKKQAEEKKKEMERKLKIKNEKETRQLREDIEKVYNESIELYKENRNGLSKEKFDKFEKMLSDGRLDEKYVSEMRNRLQRDKAKIHKEIEKERKKQEEIARKEEEKRKREEMRLEKKKQAELAKLKEKIKLEEDKLAKEKEREEREKAREEKRLQALKEKEEKRLEAEKKIEEARLARLKLIEEKKLLREKRKLEKKEKLKKRDESRIELLRKIEEERRAEREGKEGGLAKKEKQLELKRLVEERREDLKDERELIQEEFEKKLKELYDRAVKLFKDGSYVNSKNIFETIEELKPGYNSTEKYLNKINKIIKVETKNVKSKQPNVTKVQEKINEKSVMAPPIEIYPSHSVESIDNKERSVSELTKDRKSLIEDALNSVEQGL